jgi:ribose transport system ATP-binding protein
LGRGEIVEEGLLDDKVAARPGNGPATSSVLTIRGMTKSFGTTQAVRGVDFEVNRAEIVGLAGGNGAGKSTLMKIVGGLLGADEGEMRLFGETIGPGHSPAVAARLGVRFVHQELSLCLNLRVFENFTIELPDLIAGVRWRAIAIERTRTALMEVFPGNRIDPRAKVGSLSLSQRQMIEVARAASHPATRLLILDEPTSSLGSHDAEQLRAYIRRRSAEGLSAIFISHRLHEILGIADRVVVMRNGSAPFVGRADTIKESELLRLLVGSHSEPASKESGPIATKQEILVKLSNLRDSILSDVSLEARRGEIIGLAGLEGSGQRHVLRWVFAGNKGRPGILEVYGRVAFVSGDRVGEGIFQHWPVDDNIAVSSLRRLGRWGFVSAEKLQTVALHWVRELRVRAAAVSAPITSLSGGNQQKVVIARALAAEADVILLDDPTRGVDLGAKADLYKLFRSFADRGGALLWHSTDDREFVECDRTIVMRDGRIVAEFARGEVSPERLVEASFRPASTAEVGRAAQFWIDRAGRLEARMPALIPLAAFILIFVLSVIQSPLILSPFGMMLVFSAAFALAFAAISQLFMIAAGDIDLGLGAFIGLVNAIAATWLISNPWLAAACFVLLLLAYPLMGLFIQTRAVPAIIVTLGMSFIWLGFAALRLPRAGGGAPDWLVQIIKVHVPLIPMSVYLCLFPPAVAYLVLMVWRYGVVLRGFGANPRAIEAAGWSLHRAKATLYGFAGIFAFLAGIVVTASTRGGDPTGATSMTLLSVAAVILGGGAFSGGLVSPIGTTFGVLTLVLVGTLLSLLEVNGVYLPMVQGLILLGVVGLRTLLVRRQ